MSASTYAALVGARLLWAIAFVEKALAYITRYPLLPMQILLLMLISWGGLGKSIGLDDLLWHHDPPTMLLNGLACGWLCGEVLLVRYLLNKRRLKLRVPWSLLPRTDSATEGLGEFLGLTWPACLLLIAGGKLFTARFWQEPLLHLLLPLGFLLSMLMVAAFVGLWKMTPLSVRMERLWIFNRLPGLRETSTSSEERTIHALACVFMLVFAFLSVFVYVLFLLGWMLSPIVALCFFLALLNGIYGGLAFHARGMQHLFCIILLVLGICANSSFLDPQHDYKRSFPGLEAYGPGKEIVGLDHYYRLLREQHAGRADRPELIDSAEPLRAMCVRWREQNPGNPEGKPKIVIVATSGGGIRAAVWTAVVLEGLEREMPHLRNHVRLITGASGGMVAAGLYAADFEHLAPGNRPVDPETGLSAGFSLSLACDSLSMTAQTMFLWDCPLTFVPGATGWDRGRALEAAWHRNMQPLARSFEELKHLERQGRRPSLIFSPMLVEDARRLLISNLDLLPLTWNAGEMLGMRPLRQYSNLPIGPNQPAYSVSAVEFFRLFPKSPQFAVSTAARMSATFPIISPAVSLPTVPVRRVVDAGYYDNFGVDVAGQWLLRNEDAIRKYTSGVVLIEIRAFRSGYARWHFRDRRTERRQLDPEATPEERAQVSLHPDSERELVAQSLEGLSTPIEALLTARERSMQYRNDAMLERVAQHYNREQSPPFFTTVAFECDVDANLSWTIPPWEARAIAGAFQGDRLTTPEAPLPPHIRRRVEALRRWFGSGGQ